MRGPKVRLISVSFLVMLSSFVAIAFGALDQNADPLNYYANETHNITLTYTSALPGVTVNGTYPTGYTFLSAAPGCTHFAAARNVSCTGVTTNQVVWYTVAHSSLTTEYETSTFSAVVATTGERATDIKLINISNTDVFDTLIELGRGRGAYIYSTRYEGSFQDNGTTFIPANTRTQLWYLHRIYNIGHYLGLAEEGQSLDVDCDYEDLPIVSKHPVESVVNNVSGRWNVNYTFDGGVDSSFWKMTWTSLETQNTGATALADGASIAANCTQMSYTFSSGTVRVNDGDLVNLTAASTQPITVTASASNSTAYKGQSENLILYNITNDGRYKVNQLELELQAPQYARWIGTRGELFGTSVEKYVVKLPELAAGESTVVQLVARFDVPSTATDGATLALGTWDAKFIPPWELPAYTNIPAEQNDNTIAQTITLNLNSSTTITAVRGATDTIVSELGKIREFLDELAFLVTDSVGADSGRPVDETGTDEASTNSPTDERTGGSFTGGTTIEVTQILVNNAWLIVLLLAVAVAGYMIIGGKNAGRYTGPRSSTVIYKPMIHG